MKLKQKLGVAAIFALGIFVVIASRKSLRREYFDELKTFLANVQ